MAVKTYVFNAPPEAKLYVGADVYHGGETVELDEAVVVDPRLALAEAMPAPPSPSSSSSGGSGPSGSGSQTTTDSDAGKGGAPK